MKCNNEGCEVQLNEPPLSIYVADSRTEGTAFWGHYCSATCAMGDVGSTFMLMVQEEQNKNSILTSLEEVSFTVPAQQGVGFAATMTDQGGLDAIFAPVPQVVPEVVAQGVINLWAYTATSVNDVIDQITVSTMGKVIVIETDIESFAPPDTNGKNVTRRVAHLSVDGAPYTMYNDSEYIMVEIASESVDFAQWAFPAAEWNQNKLFNVLNLFRDFVGLEALKSEVEVKPW